MIATNPVLHRELRARRKATKLPLGSQNFLAILEGVEGGFAIGAGLVAGLVFATDDRRILLITALISLIVSGFNSATVKYASEHYVDELDGREKRDPIRYYFAPAAYELISYVIVSLISLLPLFFINDVVIATVWCVVSTLIIIFAAGCWRGYLMPRHHALRDGYEMLVLALLIISIGAGSGYLLHHLA